MKAKIDSKVIQTDDLASLKEFVAQQKASGKKVALCQGHFNVIHPGHLRFLEFAKSQAQCLIVAIQGNKWIEDKVKDIFFDQEERARGIASLETVEGVIIYNDSSIIQVLEAVKPDVYVKGEEFKKNLDNENIQNEINAVEKNGGKVVFSSGDVKYASADFLEYDLIDLNRKNKNLFKKTLDKQKISIDKLIQYCDEFKDLNILVIGDTIVDQYVACDALGMSSEAPVLAIRELESKEFVGGAAVVARHAAKLGAQLLFYIGYGKG
ncbi:MAG: adenylyltransferase/cytidyltransferase family protein [Ignavibacteriales bacterium]|nr:adenylyltransferase/cytidyltransferase family protein [Ignavibacteriales bacterium]